MTYIDRKKQNDVASWSPIVPTNHRSIYDAKYNVHRCDVVELRCSWRRMFGDVEKTGPRKKRGWAHRW